MFLIKSEENENEPCIEIIVQCMLRVAETSECRAMLKFDDLFSYLLAPIVDIHYTPLLYGQDVLNNNNSSSATGAAAPALVGQHSSNHSNQAPKLERIVSSCFVALHCLLSTCAGFMCFNVNNGANLRTLLSPLSRALLNRRRGLSDASLDSFSPPPPAAAAAAANERKRPSIATSRPTASFFVLNQLVDFIYKLLQIAKPNCALLSNNSNSSIGNIIAAAAASGEQPKGKQRVQSATHSHHHHHCMAVDDDFVNADCARLFEAEWQWLPTEKMSSCLDAILVASLVEQGLLQSLLDLYFGLPVSFLQSFNSMSSDNEATRMYKSLSLKALHLFTHLYYDVFTK